MPSAFKNTDANLKMEWPNAEAPTNMENALVNFTCKELNFNSSI